ncbi:MAG: PqqD family protein [bacterium]
MDEVILEKVFYPSEDVVAREIEGEVIIVPLVAGIGDMDDELFTLNETGREVWRLLDGKRTLTQVANELGVSFEAPAGKIEGDVLGLVTELARRKMVVAR